jgi:protease secretion system membrane fusion protein
VNSLNSIKQPDDGPPIDWSEQIKIGWLVMLTAVSGFFLWAALAPLDKGVPVMGTVIVAGQKQIVQNPNQGVVEKIYVKEGQAVSSGELLMRLQPDIAAAASDTSLANYALAILTLERLSAERVGTDTLRMPKQLVNYSSDSMVQNQFHTQQQLLLDRLKTKRTELAALNESLLGLESQRTAMLDSGQSKKREQQLLDDQLARLNSLIERGFTSRASLDETELKRARLKGEIAENLGTLNKIDAQMREIKLTIERRKSEHQQEIRTLTLEAERDIKNFSGQLGAAKTNLGYSDIKAPVGGNILGLTVTTLGAVLAPGTKLMDIVPTDRLLIVEAQVPVNLIDQVRSGLEVELSFSAFQMNKTPRLTGKLTNVGADRMTDQRNGMPYYPVNISIQADSLKKLYPNELRPGMPVDVFIKTGERTFLSYVIKPITDRIRSAMSEE